MFGILIPNGQSITDVDSLGSQSGGSFDEPSDFWTNWFRDTQVPRNISGYSIIYYCLCGNAHVFEWPAVGEHAPFYWNQYPENQVFRSSDQDTGANTAFDWAQRRIWNLDGDDHNAHLILAHTRWASGGNSDIDDPHPFIWDYPWDGMENPEGDNSDGTYTYSMEHNGTLTDKYKLRDMTQELWESWNPGQVWSTIYPYKTEHQGNNELVDSEAYFHWIICNIKLAGDVEEGLRRALIAMKNWDCYKNIIFSDFMTMYGYRGYGNLSADGYHQLVYRSSSPQMYVISSKKSYDNTLAQYTDPIANGQAVRFHILNDPVTYNDFDEPIHHNIPYSCDFENSRHSSIDSSWYLNSSDDDAQYSRIRVVETGGNRYLLMDSKTSNQYANNEANLFVNIENKHRVRLAFSWAPFGEETHAQDGVYLSDDGGQTFSKVYDMGSGSNGVWQNVVLDLDSLCTQFGLQHTSNFVIKFQQYDNYPSPTDGIGIDNISVYTAQVRCGYTMDFEDGSFDEYWETSNGAGSSRVSITTQNGPYEGAYHMTLDSSVDGQYVISNARFYVDLTDSCSCCASRQLGFYYKGFNEESNAEDGVFFSDDGGQSYVKVFTFTPTSTWQEVSIDVGSLATQYGLSMNNNFVIKLQQYDNFGVPTDGLAFDFIRLYHLYSCNYC